jgi:hypothetical protein
MSEFGEDYDLKEFLTSGTLNDQALGATHSQKTAFA